MKKMKTTLLILNLLISISLVGQITFTIKDSKIFSENLKDMVYELPLRLEFVKEKYTGETIEFRRPDKKLIYKGEFGKDGSINLFGESSFYKIRINSDRAIEGIIEEGIKIQGNIFTLNISGNTNHKIPIKIKEAQKRNNKNKIDYVPGYLLYDAIYINENYKPGQPNKTVEFILKEYGIDSLNIEGNYILTKNLKELKWLDIHRCKRGVFQTCSHLLAA